MDNHLDLDLDFDIRLHSHTDILVAAITVQSATYLPFTHLGFKGNLGFPQVLGTL